MSNEARFCPFGHQAVYLTDNGDGTVTRKCEAPGCIYEVLDEKRKGDGARPRKRGEAMTTDNAPPLDLDALLALADALRGMLPLQAVDRDIFGRDGIAGPKFADTAVDNDVGNDEARDVAAYIVAACNAVPALVAALRAAERDRDALLAPRCNADIAADPAGNWCVWIGGGRAVETHQTLEAAKAAAARWQAMIDDARAKRGETK